MSKTIAKYLSVILGPYIWIPAIFIIIILKANLGPDQLLVIFPSILIFQVTIPLLYLIVAPKLGWVGEWDMNLKEERQPIFILMIILSTINLLIIYFYGNSFLFNLNILVINLLFVLFIITIYWKISLHMSTNTAAAIVINYLYDWNLLILFITLPIIFWARLKLKKHTISQLFAGTIVTAIITLLGLEFLI